MSVSITSAQNDFLKSSKDFGGSSKEELKLTNTASAVELVAGNIVMQAQKNLVSANRVSSGTLSDSLNILDPVIKGKTVSVAIQAADYYTYVDAGVKGLKGGSSTKGYSFKNNIVGKNFKSALLKWILREGLAHRTDTHDISKREKSRAKLRKSIQANVNSVDTIAYAIGHSIKRKGLKPTNFFTKAINTAMRDAKKTLAKGISIDITLSIPKKI